MQEKRDIVTGRDRLARVHRHGKKVATILETIVLVISGAVTLIGGLRTLLDLMAPPSANTKSDED